MDRNRTVEVRPQEFHGRRNLKFTAIVACLTVVLSLGEIHANTLVYSNDFEPGGETVASGVTAGWNKNSISTTPGTAQHPADRFRGELSNGPLNLVLANLPSHNRVTVQFDLFLIRSLDGNFDLDERGPDVFTFTADGGNVLLYTTFRNVVRPMLYPEYGQSYPNTYNPSNLIQNDPRTGAVENDTMGYINPTGDFVQDSVYRLSFTFENSGNLTFQILASGLQEISNESWGVDDVKVWVTESSNPEPTMTTTRTPFTIPTFTPTPTATPRPPTFTHTSTQTPTPTEILAPAAHEILFPLSPIWMNLEEEGPEPKRLLEILDSMKRGG